MNPSELKRLAGDLGEASAKAREAIAKENAPRLKADLVRLSVGASKAMLDAAQKAAAKSLQRPRRR